MASKSLVLLYVLLLSQMMFAQGILIYDDKYTFESIKKNMLLFREGEHTALSEAEKFSQGVSEAKSVEMALIRANEKIYIPGYVSIYGRIFPGEVAMDYETQSLRFVSFKEAFFSYHTYEKKINGEVFSMSLGDVTDYYGLQGTIVRIYVGVAECSQDILCNGKVYVLIKPNNGGEKVLADFFAPKPKKKNNPFL